MSNTTDQRWLPRLALLLALATPLAGCGGSNSSSSAPAPPEERADRYCLWLMWTKDASAAARASAQVREGRPFMLVARELAHQDPPQATLNADCLPASGLDPIVLTAVKDLQLGQVSQPFSLSQGTALVMRTTDRYRRRGQSLFEQGQYAEAEKELLEDLKLHPASGPSWHLVALSRAARGDKEGALRAFDQALLFSPGDPAVINDKASTLNALGRPAEALGLYERAFELDPKNPTVMANLAWALMLENKDLGRAEGLAKAAVEAAPRQAAMWNTLGRVQQARGQHAEAVVSFHRAAQLDPQATQAGERMLVSLMALGPETVARLTGPQGSLSQAGQLGSGPKPAAKPLAAPAAPPAPPVALAQAAAPSPPPPARPAPAPAAPPAPGPAPAPAPNGQPDQGEILRTYQPEPVTINKPWTTVPSAAPAAQAFAPPPPPPPAPTPMPTPAPRTAPANGQSQEQEAPAGFYLQVASYYMRALAQQEVANWQRRGQAARLDTWSGPGGKTWFRVLLGPYGGREQAQAAGQSLKARRLVQSFFVVEQ